MFKQTFYSKNEWEAYLTIYTKNPFQTMRRTHQGPHLTSHLFLEETLFKKIPEYVKEVMIFFTITVQKIGNISIIQM